MKNLKRTIKLILRRFANGKIPFIGSPLYRLVIGQELIFQQIFNSFQIKPLLNEQVFAKQNLTAVVKTHERPRLL